MENCAAILHGRSSLINQKTMRSLRAAVKNRYNGIVQNVTTHSQHVFVMFMYQLVDVVCIQSYIAGAEQNIQEECHNAFFDPSVLVHYNN